MQAGKFSIHNDYLTLLQEIGHTEYRYEFQMKRNNALPEYLKDCDFLDMWWAGFKVEDEQIANRIGPNLGDGQNYIQIKINNYLDNHFKFRQVPDIN